MDTIETRLARLERSNRRWKLLSTAAVVGAVSLLLLGAKPEKNLGDIEAKSLTLRYDDGTPAIIMDMTPRGPLISLVDRMQKGKSIVGLGAMNGNALLALSSAHHEDSISLNVGDGGAAMNFLNPEGKKTRMTVYSANGRGAMSIYDDKGEKIWAAP